MGRRKYLIREAFCSGGERWGLTVWAMVFRCEFNPRVHAKIRWIRWTTWWQLHNDNNKSSQKEQVKHKKLFIGLNSPSKIRVDSLRNKQNVNIYITYCFQCNTFLTINNWVVLISKNTILNHLYSILRILIWTKVSCNKYFEVFWLTVCRKPKQI